MCVFTLLDQGHASRVAALRRAKPVQVQSAGESCCVETDFVVAGRLYAAVQGTYVPAGDIVDIQLHLHGFGQ